MLENNLLRYGLDRRCARVRATDVAVLELDNPASNARAKIAAEIARALDEDHAEAIVLGCAGMADLAASLSVEFGVPVIDGVAAAVVMAEGLAAIGLRTSKRGGFAPPVAEDLFGPVRAVFAQEPVRQRLSRARALHSRSRQLFASAQFVGKLCPMRPPDRRRGALAAGIWGPSRWHSP